MSHTLKKPLLNASNTPSTDLLKAWLTYASTNSPLIIEKHKRNENGSSQACMDIYNVSKKYLFNAVTGFPGSSGSSSTSSPPQGTCNKYYLHLDWNCAAGHAGNRYSWNSSDSHSYCDLVNLHWKLPLGFWSNPECSPPACTANFWRHSKHWGRLNISIIITCSCHLKNVSEEDTIQEVLWLIFNFLLGIQHTEPINPDGKHQKFSSKHIFNHTV